MFIKLTGAVTDSPVFVRVDNIILADTKLDGEKIINAIYVQGCEGYFVVKETPEQIMEMIENARN